MPRRAVRGRNWGTAEGCTGYTEERLPSVLTGLLQEGPQGSGAEKAGFQSLESGGTSGGRLGWHLGGLQKGWGGPRWKDGLPPALGLVPGLPRKRQPEIEPLPSAGEAQAPNHWIAMEFPTIQYF